MAALVHIQYPKAETFRMNNNSGADIVDGEFVVLAGKSLIALEDVDDGDDGVFQDADGCVVEAEDFVAGEATFSLGGAVYFKAATSEFSNTLTSGYYKVGYAKAARSSGVLYFFCEKATDTADDISALTTAVADMKGTGWTTENLVDAYGDLSDHISDTTDAHDASAISLLDTATLFTAEDVEAALAEIAGAGRTTETVKDNATAISDHLTDASDAHDASAISLLDSATLYAAEDVEAALAEIAGAGRVAETVKGNATAISDHITDTTDAHDASAVSLLDSDNRYTAEDVETALAEIAGAGRTTETVKANADAIVAAQNLAGKPFRKTGTLTAAAAATPVHLLTAAEVGAGKKAYLLGAILKVDGAADWVDGAATIVTIQDDDGTPDIGLTYAKAQLTGNAVLVMGMTGVTIGDPVAEGVGFTEGKGIDIAADANFGAGDDIKVTVFGYIA